MLDAGQRDTQITFERAEVGQDDFGEEQSTWSTVGTEWAFINWGRGDERRQAAMERGVQAATFTVLDNPSTRTISIKDRIVFAEGVWDITSSVPGKRWGERDITAVRSV